MDKAVADLQTKSARFAPTDLTADITALPPNERDALAHMVRAAQVMDALFLEQAWAGNETMLYSLIKDESPVGKARLHEFLINKGPWSRLDHNAVIIPGAPGETGLGELLSGRRHQGGSREMDRVAERGGEDQRDRILYHHPPRSRRHVDRGARTAPSIKASWRSRRSTCAPPRRRPRNRRSRRFSNRGPRRSSSNDYYDSDVKWMELDATIEPTIGPYEVYEDEWFNYKAAFEAFITVKDKTESDKLQHFAGSLQEIENNLPIDAKYRNPKLGALAPIVVVNTVFSAGDGNRGVQTAAFNLPNDERVIREKGSKRVMLKNNQQAKFDKVLVPISKVALASAEQGNVAFDAFFTHILMHELMHGLGPHDINVGGRTTTVRQELKDTYSTIEEAKADISGLFALQFLVDKGQLDKKFEQTMYTTFLASAFRSLRFGVNEAHGRGQAIQLNYLLDKGAFKVNGDGTFTVDAAKIRDGVTALTREIMTLQAEGSYAKAKQMIDTLGVLRPQAKAVLDKLTSVPVDIEPRFVTAIDLLK